MYNTFELYYHFIVLYRIQFHTYKIIEKQQVYKTIIGRTKSKGISEELRRVQLIKFEEERVLSIIIITLLYMTLNIYDSLLRFK